MLSFQYIVVAVIHIKFINVHSQVSCSCGTTITNWQCTDSNGNIFKGGESGFVECVDERDDIWDSVVDCKYCYKCVTGGLGECECDTAWNCGTGISQTLQISALTEEACMPQNSCYGIEDYDTDPLVIGSKISCTSDDNIFYNYYDQSDCTGTETISMVDIANKNNLKCDQCADYFHVRVFDKNCSNNLPGFKDQIWPLGCFNFNNSGSLGSFEFSCTETRAIQASYDGHNCAGSFDGGIRWIEGCELSINLQHGTTRDNTVEILYCGQSSTGQPSISPTITTLSITSSTQSGSDGINGTFNDFQIIMALVVIITNIVFFL